MIPLDLIKQFVSTDETRPYAETAFFGTNCIFVTDGRVVLELQRTDELAAISRDISESHPRFLESAEKLIREAKWMFTSFVPMENNLPPLELEKCTICGGNGGLIICPECHNETGRSNCGTCIDGWIGGKKAENEPWHRCDDCDGQGTNEKMFQCAWGEHIFNSFYIRKLLQLPRVKLTDPRSLGDGEPMAFRFDGGRGLLMPMRKIEHIKSMVTPHQLRQA